jgi:hypothetical protein
MLLVLPVLQQLQRRDSGFVQSHPAHQQQKSAKVVLG